MPILWLSLAFLGGILLAVVVTLGVPAWLGMGAAGLLLAGAAWGAARRFPSFHRRLPRLRFLPAGISLPLLAGVLCLGAARWQAAQPAFGTQDLAWYNDQAETWVVRGVVIAPPQPRLGYTRLRLQVEEMRRQDEDLYQPVQGVLLLLADPGDWAYGDRLQASGTLRTPSTSERFDYRGWLRRQGIYSQMSPFELHRLGSGEGSWLMNGLMQLRQRAAGLLFRLFPASEAALLAGILLGDESALSAETQAAFQATGTAHIVAISGFNMTIIAALAFSLAVRLLGRWRGMAAAIGILAAYTLLVGAQPPVVRAAIFGGLAMFGRQIGRRQQGLNSLALAAALLALFNPFVLGDVGFQLSVSATLGLILYVPPVEAKLQGWVAQPPGWLSRLPERWRAALGGWVSEYFLCTLAAQLMTLPVLLYHFQEISLKGLLVNVLVLPAQPAVMILGGLALLAGLVWGLAGQVLAWIAWPFPAYTLGVVSLFGGEGGVAHLGTFSLTGVVLLVALLLGGAAWLNHPQKLSLPKMKPVLPLAVLAALAMLTWNQALRTPDGRLHLVVLDACQGGQSGDALLIQAPGGRTVLVNGGPSANQLSQALAESLPYLGGKLDRLVVASVVDEQIQALPEMVKRYPPGEVIWLGGTHASQSARLLQAELAEAGIEPQSLEPGSSLDLGSGARLHLLAVTPRGGVLLLEYGNFRALLPLGVDQAVLADLDGLPVTALLLAESGYAPANPPEWIRRWQPSLALLSVAADDRDGRPDAEVLEALRGIMLLRTDRNGWIELSTDGEQMWVEVERK